MHAWQTICTGVPQIYAHVTKYTGNGRSGGWREREGSEREREGREREREREGEWERGEEGYVK